MPGVFTVNSIDAYEAGCLAGLGIIQAPQLGVSQMIDDGALVQVLPQYHAEPMTVSLLYAQRRNVSARVQVFMDWLAQIMAPYLEAA